MRQDHPMRITVLVDNREDPQGRGSVAEHGLSLLVDVGSGSFLFDTGATARFLENARRLGRRIEDVPCAAISHGHYDHGGGLRAFLEANARARVFVRHGTFDEHFARQDDGGYRSIGLEQDLFERNRDRFALVDETAEVLPGVWLLGDIRGGQPLPRDTGRFFLRDGGGYRPDDFSHEMIAILRDERGLVVLSGCSHRGALNALETAERRFPGEPIRALIGGFHLLDPAPGKLAEPEEEVARIGRLLLMRDGLRVWTGHCTGSQAVSILQRELGDRMTVLSTGQVIVAQEQDE
jgi:7,8-dihydropterin-6-yl-methyl-4-(beta-D-ribofuranosyl)aminobenzene 5'-phosphate synthase